MLKSLLRSQSSNEQEQQRLEGNLQSQQKEELIIEKKTLAGKLQNYLTVSQMRYEPGVEIGSQVQVSIFYFWFLPFFARNRQGSKQHQRNYMSEYSAVPGNMNFSLGSNRLDVGLFVMFFLDMRHESAPWPYQFSKLKCRLMSAYKMMWSVFNSPWIFCVSPLCCYLCI